MLEQKIIMFDGAMGTMIQQQGLTEEDFRGTSFLEHPSPLKGNNDLLSITRPDVIEKIHLEFLKAGTDILGTNTFNANRISQADYNLEKNVAEINRAAVAIARKAVKFSIRTNGRGNSVRSPHFCRRIDRTYKPYLFHVSRCKQSGLPRGDIRPDR